MSLITNIIPLQSFERIRDRIGLILADEMHNQSVLDGNNKEIDPTVFVERVTPFDHSEMPCANVMFAKGTYDGQTQIRSDGTYTFNIDFYTKGKSSDDDPGDKLSIFRLHRLIGIARYIFCDPQYNTLAFAKPFIMSIRVSEINIADPAPKDSASTAMGRLNIVVKVSEQVTLVQPVSIAGFDTQVKMEIGDSGYFYSKPA